MRAERFALQFLGVVPGTEQVHTGFPDGHHLLGVGDGEPMHFGERILETDVMPRLVLHRQSVRSRYGAMAMVHGLIGVDGERRVHVFVLACHVDGGHEVRQFAPAVDHSGNPYCRGLCQ